MSLDDLFGLLLFLAFVILPTLGRATRRKPTPQRGAGPAAPGPSASTRPASTAAAGPATDPGADELERRLAEARERVRRALEGPNAPPPARSQAPSSGPANPAPSSGAPVRGTPASVPRTPRPAPLVRDRDDGLLSTPIAPQAFASLGPEGRTRRPAASPRTEAPALQVERRTPTGLRQAPVFATDPQTLVSAIVWHQVLGEPRAHRPVGGRPSTLRSR